MQSCLKAYTDANEWTCGKSRCFPPDGSDIDWRIVWDKNATGINSSKYYDSTSYSIFDEESVNGGQRVVTFSYRLGEFGSEKYVSILGDDQFHFELRDIELGFAKEFLSWCYK